MRRTRGNFHKPPECNPAKRSVSYIATSKNRNVRLALLFTFLSSASRGIWAFVILSNFIHVLTNSTVTVGFAEGIQGLSQCIFALVAGIAADRFSREFSLKLAGIFLA